MQVSIRIQWSNGSNYLGQLEISCEFSATFFSWQHMSIFLHQWMGVLYQSAILWSLLNRQKLWGFSLSIRKGDPTYACTQIPAYATRMTRSASAAFVQRSATHALFYINSRCKQACQFSDNHTLDKDIILRFLVHMIMRWGGGYFCKIVCGHACQTSKILTFSIPIFAQLPTHKFTIFD